MGVEQRGRVGAGLLDTAEDLVHRNPLSAANVVDGAVVLVDGRQLDPEQIVEVLDVEDVADLVAQAAKAQAPAKNYRVAQGESKPMFANKPSPGIGTGAVGPLFVGLACLLRRFRSRS